MELEQFEMLEELGRGGFGIVYKAKDIALERNVAIKVLHPNLVNDPTFISRFRQEAKIAVKLKHSNIVPVYGFGVSEGRYFIIMDYMPGGSLKDLLKDNGPLDKDHTLTIFQQLTAGLTFIHSKNIVHRDLKPGNILFDSEGKAHISDLGFAKLLHSDSSVSISTSGGLVGTPAYLAPEIWKGKPVSPASDVYSIACILVEMMTGKPLFDGDTTPMVMFKHFQRLQLPDNLPPAWTPIITKGLAENPDDRPAINLFTDELTNLSKSVLDNSLPHQIEPIMPTTGRFTPLIGKQSKDPPLEEPTLHVIEDSPSVITSSLPTTGRFIPLTGKQTQLPPPFEGTVKPISKGFQPLFEPDKPNKGWFNPPTADQPTQASVLKQPQKLISGSLPPWLEPPKPNRGWFTPQAGTQLHQTLSSSESIESILETSKFWDDQPIPDKGWNNSSSEFQRHQPAYVKQQRPVVLQILVGFLIVIGLAVILYLQTPSGKPTANQVYYQNPTLQAPVAGNSNSSASQSVVSVPDPTSTKRPTSTSVAQSTRTPTKTATASLPHFATGMCGQYKDNCLSQYWNDSYKITINFRSTTLKNGTFDLKMNNETLTCKPHTSLYEMFSCTGSGKQFNTHYTLRVIDKQTGQELGSGTIYLELAAPTSKYGG